MAQKSDPRRIQPPKPTIVAFKGNHEITGATTSTALYTPIARGAKDCFRGIQVKVFDEKGQAEE